MAPESLSKKIGIVRVDPNERIGSPAAQAPDPRQRALSRAVAVGALVAHLCLLYGITRLDLTYAIPRKKSLEIPVELVTGLPGDDKGGKGGAGQKKSADKAKGLPPAPKVAQKQANPAPKAEVKNEPKPESKPAPKEEAKLEPKPAPKPPAQPSPKPEAKPEPKPEAAKPPAPKPQLAKPEAPKPEAKPAPKPPPAKAEAKPLKPAPEPSPKQTAEAKPAPPKPPAEPKPPAPKPAEAKPPVAAAKPPPPPPPPAPTLPALATLSPTLGPASQQLMADTGHAASQTNLPAAGPRVPQMSENFTAVAVPSPTQDGDLLTAYKTLVFSKLELAKKFPEDARKRHAHGSAIVAFAIDAQGHVLRVTLLQSSGDTELDVASLALVQRAAPFPPPPPGAQREFAAVVEFDASH